LGKLSSTRYLFRLSNKNERTPKDIDRVRDSIRMVLGSRESATHFRISSNAVEFNLYAHNNDELGERERLLEEHGFEIIGKKLLDTPSIPIGRIEALKEGIALFNEERFWESHEILEQLWRESTGGEREILQGLILTAAAFVHYQKNEPDVCLSVLKRARSKIGDR